MDPEGKGPFDKDVLETKKEEPAPLLPESNFIQEPVTPAWRSFPIWLWLFLATALLSILWGTRSWYQGYLYQEKKTEPFLEVSNRDFSVFLWQFPAYVRSNGNKRMGYLTGFFSDRAAVNPEQADQLVSAPPDLLFLYHTWKRLLLSEELVRPVPPQEFSEFLKQAAEWLPSNWKGAPESYKKLIESGDYNKKELNAELPLAVRLAFQGWKNYHKEGSAINQLNPTVGEVKQFIEAFPHYQRNFWRNINEVDGRQVAGRDYLYLLLQDSPNSSDTFPSGQIPSFLKVALYNWQQKEQN